MKRLFNLYDKEVNKNALHIKFFRVINLNKLNYDVNSLVTGTKGGIIL